MWLDCWFLPREQLAQEWCCDALAALCYLLRSAFGDDASAVFAGFGSHVDDVVGAFYHIEVVFDDDYRVASVDKPIQYAQQHAYVLEVQACGGLVEQLECAAGVALGKSGGELDALALAARQRGTRLPEFDVAQTDILQHF